MFPRTGVVRGTSHEDGISEIRGTMITWMWKSGDRLHHHSYLTGAIPPMYLESPPIWPDSILPPAATLSRAAERASHLRNGDAMPEYLNFESKLADLNHDEAEQQLKLRIDLVLQAVTRLEENDRVEPCVLERMVSV